MSLKRLPPNIWILSICQALSMTASPLLIFVGGLLGRELAPSPEWATLPLSGFILGTACSSIPAALTMKRLGRKRGSYVGFGFALLGAALGTTAAMLGSFWLYFVAATVMGVNMAFAAQFRFAAYESLRDPSDYPVALSVLMLGGLVAAFLGPELGLAGKDMLNAPFGYAGSFLLQGVVVVLSMSLFALFKEPIVTETTSKETPRSLSAIAVNPLFSVAVGASAIGYGLMSLVMTATPLNMHEICGIDLTSTKQVIQGHIASMFLPSLVGGLLMKRFGIGPMLLAGTALFGGMMLISLRGQELVHFWGALIALGVGWNFLFMGGTALLPQVYRESERFKVQAVNDFIVFGAQGLGSVGAAWFLFGFGWNTLIWTCMPGVIVAAAGSIWLMRKERRRVAAG